MYLADAVRVWSEMTNRPINEYFAEFPLDTRLNRDTLVNLIFMEFSSALTCDDETVTFRFRVYYFFRIHEYNIKKLLDTMEYEYKPLTNVDMFYDRDMHVDQLDDENKTDARDLVRDFQEGYQDKEIFGRDKNTDTVNNRNKTIDEQAAVDEVENRTEKEIMDQDVTKVEDTDYTENTSSSRDDTKVTDYNETNSNDKATESHKEHDLDRTESIIHFVSAYNQFETVTEPDGTIRAGDVERDRDSTRIHEDYTEDGNSTENEDGTKNYDETVTDAETTTSTKTSKTGLVGTEDAVKTTDTTEKTTKDYDEIRGIKEKEDETDEQVVREDTEKKSEYVKKSKLTDNEDKVATRNNDMDRDETENRHDYGNDGRYSYQELISEERNLAEFNIYKWILRHMAKELFICVY